MKLKEWKTKINKDISDTRVCKLFGKEMEDLIHFMIKCEVVEDRRYEKIMDEADRRVPIEATGIHQMLGKMKKKRDYIIKKETERKKGGEKIKRSNEGRLIDDTQTIRIKEKQ